MTRQGHRHICMFLLLLLFVLTASKIDAAAAEPEDGSMLMFVGRPLSVVTTASRRPESPSAAPAVVDVVTRETIARRGYQTLGELLSFEPGFYIAPHAQGSTPYLRGLPGSVLFLYNGIPMPSGGTQSVFPLDRELSLDHVRQVEIIRGPGSVLWGSDAFAGIVNVVSMGPEDQTGTSLKLSGGSHNEKKAYAAASMSGKTVSAFLSASGSRHQYHDPDYNRYSVAPSGAIQGTPAELDDSKFLEITARGEISDWLSFSGRFSDFTRNYAAENETGLRWNGTRETPVNHIGLSADTTMGRSHLMLSAYYLNQSITHTDMNTRFEETLDQFSGEVLWDRSFQHTGILTLGATFRESRISGAQAGTGFLPSAVLTPFPMFTQQVAQSSYDSRVTSGFAQYRHQFGNASLWAGVRLEDHSDFSTHIPWNIGASWDPDDQWRFKAVLGRAFRTPYSQQIIWDLDQQTTEIDTLSLQAVWRPGDMFEVDVTGFYSAVSGAVIQDPYAGISNPAKQDIYGVEVMVRAMLDNTRLFAGLSALRYDGNDFLLTREDFTLVNPDGSLTVFYESWQRPFGTGPDLMFKTGLYRQVTDTAGVSFTGAYTADLPYSYSKNTVSGRHDDYWLFSATVSIRDLLFDRTTLRIGVKNLFDASYTTAGYYGPVSGAGRTVFVEWGMAW